MGKLAMLDRVEHCTASLNDQLVVWDALTGCVATFNLQGIFLDLTSAWTFPVYFFQHRFLYRQLRRDPVLGATL